MTQVERRARGPALAVAAALIFACSLTAGSSIGEAKKAKPEAQPGAQPAQGPQPAQSPADQDQALKKQQAAAARQAYDSGLKAFANGKYQPAVDQLSTALKGGGLAPAEMAKAFYTRGISYKKLNKPGLAISDLTSALWLKNGLAGSDREAATAERAEAFRMAGLEDTGKGPDRAVVANPNVGVAPDPVPGPAPTVNSSSAGLSAAAIAQAAASQPSSPNASAPSSAAPGTVTRQDGTSEAAQDAARARASYSSADDGGLQSAAASTVVATSTMSAAAAPVSSSFAPAAEPAPASGISSVPSTVAGFFSNMFGGGTPAPAAAAAPSSGVTTASTSPAAPETSSWSSSTVVSDGSTHAEAPVKIKKQHMQTAAATPTPVATIPEPVAAAPSGKPGKYKVHIAALRSRAEAEALAQQLVAQHGADLSNHAPTVDEAVIGSMGTFYRVRVGGYASQDEPRGLCNKLRTSGLDCLVVTN